MNDSAWSAVAVVALVLCVTMWLLARAAHGRPARRLARGAGFRFDRPQRRPRKTPSLSPARAPDLRDEDAAPGRRAH